MRKLEATDTLLNIKGDLLLKEALKISEMPEESFSIFRLVKRIVIYIYIIKE